MGFEWGVSSMKAIVCEVCGSNDLVKQEGVFVCQYCGTKYSLDDVKKLYAEVSGTVKIDSSDDINNLYVVARRAVQSKNYESGKKFYENILMKDSSSWEATFYSMYCQVMSVTKENYEDTVISYGKCVNSVFTLIKDFVSDIDERHKIILEVTGLFISSCNYLFNCSVSFSKRNYHGINGYNVSLIYSYLGDSLLSNFGNDYASISCKCWKLFVNDMIYLFKHSLGGEYAALAVSNANVYVKKIRRFDASYKIPLILSYSYLYDSRYVILISLFVFFIFISGFFKSSVLLNFLFFIFAVIYIFLDFVLPRI